MIKTMLSVIALVLGMCGAAKADTIDLYTTAGFGNLKQFYHVPNSIGANINITMSTAYPGIYLNIDELTCSSPVGPSVSLQCADGSSIDVSLNLSSVRRQINQGRLHTWVTNWTLVSGTITRP